MPEEVQVSGQGRRLAWAAQRRRCIRLSGSQVGDVRGAFLRRERILEMTPRTRTRVNVRHLFMFTRDRWDHMLHRSTGTMCSAPSDISKGWVIASAPKVVTQSNTPESFTSARIS